MRWQIASHIQDEVIVHWIGGTRLAARRGMTGLTGCKSKQDAAIEQAKEQAAAQNQAQQVVYTDKDGNTVTTTVQPPVPGQSGQIVTTVVTPKGQTPDSAAPQTADATPPPAAAPATNSVNAWYQWPAGGAASEISKSASAAAKQPAASIF